MLCLEPLKTHPEEALDVADMVLIGRYFDPEGVELTVSLCLVFSKNVAVADTTIDNHSALLYLRSRTPTLFNKSTCRQMDQAVVFGLSCLGSWKSTDWEPNTSGFN